MGKFRADLLVEEAVVVELKAARTVEAAHEAQLLNALKATDIEVGLHLNFGPRPQFKRMAFADTRKQIRVHPRSSAAETVTPIGDQVRTAAAGPVASEP